MAQTARSGSTRRPTNGCGSVGGWSRWRRWKAAGRSSPGAPVSAPSSPASAPPSSTAPSSKWVTDMMRWIILASLRFRTLVVLGGILLMFGGAVQLSKAPVDVFPEFAPPKVEIQTACVGLSAAEVEELITVPLEQSLAGMPGLDVLRSKSVGQLSSVVLLF